MNTYSLHCLHPFCHLPPPPGLLAVPRPGGVPSGAAGFGAGAAGRAVRRPLVAGGANAAAGISPAWARGLPGV